MKLNETATFAQIHTLVSNLNQRHKGEELALLQERHFSNYDDDEMREALEGKTIEQYFESEMNDLDSYEASDIGDDCIIGRTFVVINDPDGDVYATFVMTGYAGQGVFTCCYINPAAQNAE